MDLAMDGRAYYVTGGSRGIGRALVTLLLAEGASVATCARDGVGLDRLRTTLPQAGRRLATHVADVRDAAALTRAVQDAVGRFGRLDGVVANAGAGSFGGVLDTPDDDWRNQFAIKVLPVLHLVGPARAALAGSDAGRVVVVNGVTAHAPEPGMAAVGAARAATANLVRSLAVELAADGILVNAVNPGAIATDRQHARYTASGSDEPFDAWCAAEARRRGVLLGRLGRPEEVAAVVAFLLSPLASYLTGASVDVSGGSGGRV